MNENQRIVGIHNRVWVPPEFFRNCYISPGKKVEHLVISLETMPKYVLIKEISLEDPPHKGRTTVFRRRMTLPKYACEALEIKKGDKVEFWMAGDVICYWKVQDSK